MMTSHGASLYKGKVADIQPLTGNFDNASVKFILMKRQFLEKL
jgi:hypothetical protein